MMELLGNAWSGWINYTTQGKLAALFLVLLLYIWFRKKHGNSKQLVLYATVAAGCCIFPITAAILMTYQTKFYDYQWIWSVVPLTAVIAYGATCFLSSLWWGKKPGKKPVCFGVTVLCLAITLLCGSMGAKRADYTSVYMKFFDLYDAEDPQLRERVYKTIAALKERAGDKELVLWGPVEVMEYAREADASVRLAYGRNVWDISLNAYSYDAYDEMIEEMFIWMELQNAIWEREYLETSLGVSEVPSGEECIGKALELGVNCVLLPAETYDETIAILENALGAKAQRIDGYWVICQCFR